jgi:phage terminase large subunit
MLAGERVVGVREVQKSIQNSVKQLVEDKILALGVQDEFAVQRDEIRCRSGGNMIFRGLQDHTAESIKSLENYTRCWIEEAQTISERSLRLLTPTIRSPGSEIWATWNPRYDHDPIDILLRGAERPSTAIVVRANWQDNPFFPSDLRADLERDKAMDLETYLHVWEGDYQRIGEGAYYAKELAKVRADGRVDEFPIEREPPIHTGWDLGIDDCTAIWAAQVVGMQVRLIDYYEDRGEDAKHYAEWALDHGYNTGEALLPHDAGIRDLGQLLSYEEHLNRAGLKNTRVLPRTTDLMGDIQRTRSFLAKCYFRDVPEVQEGLKVLGAYRVEMDTKLRTPKPRPVHDWASHGSDAFRQLAVGLIPEGRTPYSGIRINLPGERARIRGRGPRRYRAALASQRR